jgi:Ca-activated chloride channel family protein
MVLLAFSIGNDDIDIYLNQLNKSMEFIYNNCMDPNSKLESRIAKMTILALNGAIEKKIFKVRNLEKAHKTVSNLYKILTEREDAEEILNDLTEYSFKKSVISLFKINEDGSSISEKIVISVENNSIFSMAKLAVLKGLKSL